MAYLLILKVRKHLLNSEEMMLDLLAETILRDGKRYMKYYDMEYEVLGVIATDNGTRVNNMILMDFKSALRFYGDDGKYEIDTRDRNTTLSLGGVIDKWLVGKANTIIMLEEGSPQSIIKQMFTGSSMLNTLYAMILFCFSLCTVLVTSIWFKFRNNLTWAYELCGYSFLSKTLELAKRYYLITIVAFLIGVACMGGICANLSDIKLLPGDVIMALGFTLGIGTLIMVVLVFVKMGVRVIRPK